MDPFAAAIDLMPRKIQASLSDLSSCSPEELRLRVGQPPSVLAGGKERFVSAERVEEQDLARVLEKATGASLYHAAEAMRQGYYCVGPLRIGICGRVTAGGRGFSSYTSLCVRLSRECRGVCREAADKLLKDGYRNTLIVSPPGGGKTTALRDLIRSFADRGLRMGVVDERGELSSEVYDLGRCSDVISGLDKLSGALLLLRSMTPQIIAADEISAPTDVAAIREIYGCGTGILATAHASDREDLLRRRAYRDLIGDGIFSRLLVIRQRGAVRTYEIEAL